jgi:ABC-type dipeptide/oligopeptide/nickel transport system permease component
MGIPQSPSVEAALPRRRLRGASGAGIRYASSRLAQGLLVVFGAITISFVLIHLTGNPAEVLAGGQMSREQVAQLSKQLGYERPLVVQYFDYLGNVARGDLGDSFRFQEPAIKSVSHALPRTLLLVGTTILVACAFAIPAAVFSVRRRESLPDRALRRGLILGQGMPEFWLALILVLLFSVKLGWLPSIGLDGPRSLILPVATLALPLTAMLVRLLRAELLDIMTSDFVVALRSKGLTENSILLRHGLRNALIPFVTFLALQIGWLIGGTIIVENVFVWPGIGTLALSAVQVRDLTVIQAIVIIVAVSYVILNLLVDLVMMWIDPRIRTGAA